MGKQGPCRHCGTTSTPLWRNGPPDKPVLCNACGSRWRTKGSLANYLPLLTREFPGSEDIKFPKVPKVKSISFKPNEQKPHNKKVSNASMEIKREMLHCSQSFPKVLEEDLSNRSSSGSAISYSESCAHLGTTDANELTASAQSNAWDTLVPSRKRTFLARPKASHVEKLRRELCIILHEQESSYVSEMSEGDLIYGSETPTGSVEIGNGGVLIRLPNSKNSEEESESSSFIGHGKASVTNEDYSGSTSFLVHSASKTTDSSIVAGEKVKKSTTQVAEDHVKRDRLSHEKLRFLQDRDSPLTTVDLKDVISFEAFIRLLSHEEQQQLMKYLPPVDTAKSAKSLRSLFYTSQFLDTLSYFQQLLFEGVFDLSSVGEKTVGDKTLKRLALCNLTKCRWVEYYKQLQDAKLKENTGEKEIDVMLNIQKQSDNVPIKRSLDTWNQNFPELNTVKSPMRSLKTGGVHQSTESSLPNSCNEGSRAIGCANDFVDDGEACFCPRSLFAFPPERSSLLASLQFTDDSSSQGFFLDVPFNCSFLQAEPLLDPSKERKVLSSLPRESGSSWKEASLSNDPSSSCSSK